MKIDKYTRAVAALPVLAMTIALAACNQSELPATPAGDAAGGPVSVSSAASVGNAPAPSTASAANAPVSEVNWAADVDPSILTVVGQKTPGVGVVSTGKAGVLTFGPYASLQPGRYRLEIYGLVKDAGKSYMAFEAVYSKGTTVLGAAPISKNADDLAAQRLSVVEFTAPEGVVDFEARTVIDNGVEATIKHFVLRKLP